EVRAELAGTLNTLAQVLAATGRAGEAGPVYRPAGALWGKPGGEFPRGPGYPSNLGGPPANPAPLPTAHGQWGPARPLGEQAIRRQQEALDQKPDHPGYRRLLGGHYRVLADALTGLGKDEEAARARAKSAALRGRGG